MPHSLEVVLCQTCGCANEIVLPYPSLLRVRQQSLRRTVTGDPYLDVACPHCGYVFRYIPDMTRERVYDTRDPYQPPCPCRKLHPARIEAFLPLLHTESLTKLGLDRGSG